MEVTKQSLEQVTAAQYSQTPQVRRGDREAQSTDFDELLQRKHQQTSEPDRGAGHDGQSVRDREQADAAAPEQDAANAPEAEEVPEDAKAVLAAMLLQPQQTGEPEAVQAQAQPETALAVEAAAQGEGVQQVVGETAQPQQAQPGQDAAQQVPEQAAQGMRQAPEQAQQAGTPRAKNAGQTRQAEAQQAPERSQAAGADPVRAQRAGTQEDGEPDAQLVEAPVFQQVEDAVPVKVAEPVLNPESPVPIEDDQAPRQMAELFTRSVDNGDTIGVIQITPENLGPVTMTISRDAQGALHMALEALNPRTAALLEKHSANIEHIAAQNTHQDVHVEIRSEHSQPFPENWKENGNGQQQQQQGRRQEQDAEEPAQDFMHRLRLGLNGEAE